MEDHRDKIVWQPVFDNFYNFHINLDRGFAREMIMSKRAKERDINRLVKTMSDELGIVCDNPYGFYGNTTLLNQINIGEGNRLTLEGIKAKRLLEGDLDEKNITYISYNIRFASDAYALMFLFSNWVRFAPRLKE
jgi:hypothetical protein